MFETSSETKSDVRIETFSSQKKKKRTSKTETGTSDLDRLGNLDVSGGPTEMPLGIDNRESIDWPEEDPPPRCRLVVSHRQVTAYLPPPPTTQNKTKSKETQ